MSRNAAGTYSLPAGNPVVTNSVISSTWANTTLTDIASALTDSLSRSGLGSMTAGLPLFDGTIGLPGLTFATETTAGLRRASAGNFRFTIGGVDVLTITATSVTGVGIPNLAAANTFTQSGLSTPAITLASAIPVLLFHETDAAANNGKWYVQGNNEAFQMGATNDAFGVQTNWVLVNRTGTTIDDITIAATAVVFGASNLSGSGTGAMSGAWTFSQSGVGATGTTAITLSSALPTLNFNETDAAANNRLWQFFAQGELFGFRIADDAASGNNNVMLVDRTGTTVDRVAFPTDSASSIPFTVGATPSSSGALTSFSTANAATQAFIARNITATTSTLAVWNAATSGDNVFSIFITEGGSGTTRGSITYNRGGGLVAYNVTSDGRLKKNIRNSADAGVLIDQIKVRAFEWQDGNSALPHWLVAQELAPLVPYAVTVPSDPEGMWSVDPSKLVPLLVKAVQELRMRIAAMETR